MCNNYYISFLQEEPNTQKKKNNNYVDNSKNYRGARGGINNYDDFGIILSDCRYRRLRI